MFEFLAECLRAGHAPLRHSNWLYDIIMSHIVERGIICYQTKTIANLTKDERIEIIVAGARSHIRSAGFVEEFEARLRSKLIK